jgi:hypothetical protein
MPERETLERAREDARKGKSPTTQAGEFVREEMHHVRERKHGAASPQQTIAIGLSKARRSGVKLQAPRKRRTSSSARNKAQQDRKRGQSYSTRKPSRTRSSATSNALKRKRHAAASRRSLSRHSQTTARRRSPAARHQAAMKARGTRARKRR